MTTTIKAQRMEGTYRSTKKKKADGTQRDLNELY